MDAQNRRGGPHGYVEPHYAGKCGVAECTLSLGQAMQEAGGTVSESLLDMTLRDFIVTCAGQNHIRFVFKKPKGGKDA